MHNTNSNTNPLSNHLGPLEWANQFVPLPPTEFPDEVPIHNFVNERPTMELGTPATSPLNNANLPCLQDIAGVDPFFTPVHTPAASPPPSNPAADFSSIDQAPRTAAVPPRVEVIGQHAEQPPTPNLENATPPATPAEPQEHQKAEVELMNQSDFNNTHAEIHEYDLAMKVLPNTLPNTTVAAPQSSIEPTEVADIAASTQSDISSYWSQDNVSSFIPGVTPLEAYPVCQAFAEQISTSGESESITLSDIQLDQLLSTAANIKSTTDLDAPDDAETSQPAEDAAAAAVATAEETDAQAEATVEPNAVPVQVDPFADDTFESTLDVSLVKTTNQICQQTQPTAEDTSPACLETQLPETQLPEPVVPEIPNLAARQVDTPQVDTPSASVSDAAEFETADSQPIDQVTELPNEDKNEDENEFYQESNSNELFESVEQSLSDLQTINHYDSNAEFSPAVDAIEALPEIETASAAPVEPEPANVEQQHAQQHASAPTFQPIDLIANLPSVQQPEPQLPAEPDFSQAAFANNHTPETPPANQPVEQTFLPAGDAWNQQIQQPAESAIAQDAPHVESATTFTEDSQQEPEVPALDLIEPAQQTSLQADPHADRQVPELEEPTVAQQAPDSDPELESDFQVIQVDGNEGYDFLDLKAFDVAHATFLPGKIFLDDGATKFQIQYSNLKLAVFAGEFQVELT